jgi:FkbM family methyltransferase
MEAKIQQYLDFDGGVFIECGANDGYEQSNTYYLEKFRNWKGLLIEAIPDLFKSCKSVRPNAISLNCALGETDNGTLTIRSENLISTIIQAADRSDSHRKYIQIASRTLSSVLDELGFTRIDFFSLDVEGFELSVLKGLNSDRHHIRYILVETSNMEAVAAVLGDNYKLVDQFSHHDYLFERAELDAAHAESH